MKARLFENIEFLICILAKNLYSLSLPVMLFIWRYSDSVWLPYSSCQDGEVMTFRKTLLVCTQYLFCVIQSKLVCCIFQVFYKLTEILQIPTLYVCV